MIRISLFILLLCDTSFAGVITRIKHGDNQYNRHAVRQRQIDDDTSNYNCRLPKFQRRQQRKHLRPSRRQKKETLNFSNFFTEQISPQLLSDNSYVSRVSDFDSLNGNHIMYNGVNSYSQNVNMPSRPITNFKSNPDNHYVSYAFNPIQSSGPNPEYGPGNNHGTLYRTNQFSDGAYVSPDIQQNTQISNTDDNYLLSPEDISKNYQGNSNATVIKQNNSHIQFYSNNYLKSKMENKLNSFTGTGKSLESIEEDRESSTDLKNEFNENMGTNLQGNHHRVIQNEMMKNIMEEVHQPMGKTDGETGSIGDNTINVEESIEYQIDTDPSEDREDEEPVYIGTQDVANNVQKPNIYDSGVDLRENQSQFGIRQYGQHFRKYEDNQLFGIPSDSQETPIKIDHHTVAQTTNNNNPRLYIGTQEYETYTDNKGLNFSENNQEYDSYIDIHDPRVHADYNQYEEYIYSQDPITYINNKQSGIYTNEQEPKLFNKTTEIFDQQINRNEQPHLYNYHQEIATNELEPVLYDYNQGIHEQPDLYKYNQEIATNEQEPNIYNYRQDIGLNQQQPDLNNYNQESEINRNRYDEGEFGDNSPFKLNEEIPERKENVLRTLEIPLNKINEVGTSNSNDGNNPGIAPPVYESFNDTQSVVNPYSYINHKIDDGGLYEGFGKSPEKSEIENIDTRIYEEKDKSNINGKFPSQISEPHELDIRKEYSFKQDDKYYNKPTTDNVDNSLIPIDSEQNQASSIQYVPESNIQSARTFIPKSVTDLIDKHSNKQYIRPGKVGEIQFLKALDTGKPALKVMTLHRKINSNSLGGTIVKPGEIIPDSGGYAIPVGFRARVFYGPEVNRIG